MNPFFRRRHRQDAAPRTNGIGRWLRPSRHRPDVTTATAESAQGARTRARLPGPPGDIHTARIATDTWPGRPPTPGISPATSTETPHQPDTAGEDAPMGGSDASG